MIHLRSRGWRRALRLGVGAAVLLLAACAQAPAVAPPTATPSPPAAPTPFAAPAAATSLPSPSTSLLPSPSPSPSPVAAGQPVVRVAGVPRFEPDPACSSESQRCGFVVVPERHDQPDGRTIKLAVQVTVRANREAPPDPVVYLQGGPGSKLQPRARSNIGSVTVRHDVILYEQRGIGKSEPALDCPERDEQRVADAAAGTDDAVRQERVRASWTACRDRLRGQGIDLAAYTTAESAADLDDIRVALGYDRLNLVGISYGTYLAQATMRAFPGSVRSVILDSVVPLDRPAIVPIPSANTDHALERTFALCAASPSCDLAYPNLAGIFVRTVQKLGQQPMPVALGPAQGGDIPLTPRLFATMVFRELYGGPGDVPRLIAAADRGDARPFVERVRTLLLFNRSFSEGAELSTICRTLGTTPNEELQFRGPGPLTPLAGPPTDWQGACALWPHVPFDAASRALVRSDIPTLIIAGELDPVTPPANGQRVAAGLSRATYVEVPAEGHTPGVRTSCGREIIAAFLDQPTVPPDVVCVKRMQAGFNVSPP
ncbi:MAG: alpha/beta fold hydrolase [Chloroflexi bacterium]|nr:alpha/beta fold hydrolase [Chloroflexota bacterium]